MPFMKNVEQQLNEFGAQLKSQRPSQASYERGLVVLKEHVAQKRNESLERAFDHRGVWMHVVENVRMATSVSVVRGSAVALAFVLLLGGAGVYAGLEARKATPSNESLYTLKTALQKTQVALSFSDAGRAKTQVIILEQRVAEVGKELERTSSNTHTDVTGVSKALANAQKQAEVVKAHLSQLPDTEEARRLAEQVAGVKGHIETYTIAASDVSSDVEEDITNNINPEIQELAIAISEITALVEKEDQELTKGEVKGDQDVVDEVVDRSVATTTNEVIDENANKDSASATEEYVMEEETDNAVEKKVIIEDEPKKVTPENDAFRVYIGD